MLELGRTRKIAVLGASGSIGKNALDVIETSNGKLEAVLLSVNTQTNILAQQLIKINEKIKSSIKLNRKSNNPNNSNNSNNANSENLNDSNNLNLDNQSDSPHLPQWVVITEPNADRSPIENLPDEIKSQIKIFYGYDSLSQLVREPEIDIVLSAVSGCAGLVATWSALETGKIVALANKESLVSGGSMIKELALKNHGNLIPVDSEHSAIWQALQSWNMKHYQNKLINPAIKNNSSSIYSQNSQSDSQSAQLNSQLDSQSAEYSDQNILSGCLNVIDVITLTASGGPFRTWSLDELKKVTVDDALNHPTWKMGAKITIDSATMMNKAFEIIEAKYLFDLDPKKIKTLIHPQSIIHSMVQFIDGSTIAQLSCPDMRIPISLALHYPYRFESSPNPIDWTNKISLDFYPPDFERFPALSLGYIVAEKGGTTGAVVNAANETAITAFQNGRLPFLDIVTACISVLENHNFENRPTLSRLLEIDAWARKETEKWISQ
jgi:1-deoxy-D-xylulose-5-phosphate reductoisomerase